MTIVIDRNFVKQAGDRFFPHFIPPNRYAVVEELLKLELLKRVKLKQSNVPNIGRNVEV